MSRRIRDYCRWAAENNLPANNLAVDIQVISIFSELMDRQKARAKQRQCAANSAQKRASLAEQRHEELRPLFDRAYRELVARDFTAEKITDYNLAERGFLVVRNDPALRENAQLLKRMTRHSAKVYLERRRATP